MFYYDYHFIGMHIIWWFFWFTFVYWIFATPYYLPGLGKRINSPYFILQKRFASGEISKEIYLEHKKMLDNKANI